MKDILLVSSAHEGTILTKAYPFSEELYASLKKAQESGLLRVEKHKAITAYLT